MIAVLSSFFLSALGCGVYLWFARSANIVDTPNARSSHTRDTPHGGGLPLFLAFFAVIALTNAATQWPLVYTVLSSMAALLVLLGILDDIFALPIKLRFVIYAASVVVASTVIIATPEMALGPTAVLLIVGVSLVMLWLVNLYNFMDGIDGIAAIQAVLACAFVAALSYSANPEYALFCALFGAAHLGFLLWNWPPARLFMGDAGSVPTGFLFASLVLLGAMQGAINPACWLILLALFITDATWTLLWRVFTGQQFMQAHRLHAYQRLSRRWQSHLRVDIWLIIICVFWLAPLAWAAHHWPSHSFVLVILAYLPWVIAMAKIRRLT